MRTAYATGNIICSLHWSPLKSWPFDSFARDLLNWVDWLVTCCDPWSHALLAGWAPSRCEALFSFWDILQSTSQLRLKCRLLLFYLLRFIDFIFHLILVIVLLNIFLTLFFYFFKMNLELFLVIENNSIQLFELCMIVVKLFVESKLAHHLHWLFLLSFKFLFAKSISMDDSKLFGKIGQLYNFI